eukprot:gene9063-16189_t
MATLSFYSLWILIPKLPQVTQSDGNRLWSKELGLKLCLVERSPDGRLILVCTPQGDCHVYDGNGNAVSKVPLYCNEGYIGTSKIIGVEWYDGIEGFAEPNCPVLAICLDNGRMQLMRYESDDNAICIDTGIKPSKCKWNLNGTILSVAGFQLGGGAQEFYNHNGEHLRTLRVPGSGITGITWEGNGLRLALAVDSAVYFANVRPDYKWGFFCNTLVYAFSRPDRTEHCVMFWDTKNNDKYPKNNDKYPKNNDKYPKYVRKLVAIQAFGDFCVLATKGENPGEYILILCNAIGSPVDSKYVEVEPKYLTITHYHVIAASDEVVYVWQFRTSFSKVLSTDISGVKRRELREKMFHIDDTNPAQSDKNPENFKSVIDINGVLSFYDLTAKGAGGVQGEHLTFERKDAWDMLWADDNPELFAMMEKTRMYIFRGLDPEEPVTSSSYLCSFHDLEISAVFMDDIMQQPDQPDMEFMTMYETRSLRDTRDLLKTTSMEDAYSFVDGNCHPRLWRILAEHALEGLDFAMADKAFVRSADYQGIQFVKHLQKLDDRAKQRAEVAVYFKRFDEAEQQYHKMDRPELAVDMRTRLVSAPAPDAPTLSHCDVTPSTAAALVSDSASDASALSFSHCDVTTPNSAASISASASYASALAILHCDVTPSPSAAPAGDWFKVSSLVKEMGGDDTQMVNAWNKIGQYYSERHKWLKAAQYYMQAKNSEMLINCFYALEDLESLAKNSEKLIDCYYALEDLESLAKNSEMLIDCFYALEDFESLAKNSEMLIDCFYALEDFESLVKLMDALPDGSKLLICVGEKFQSVGLCNEGVAAFLKAGDTKKAIDCSVLLNQWDQGAGDTKKAIDCCVLLNQWDQGVTLAQQHNFPQIEGLLAKYANHLLEKEKFMDAIELYRKANHHTEAAKLLQDLAQQVRMGMGMGMYGVQVGEDEFMDAIKLYRKANHHTEAAKLLPDLAQQEAMGTGMGMYESRWERTKFMDAIKLYRKANHHTEAAKLLQDLAQQSAAQKSAAQKVHPLRVKKLYVLAALEIDKFKKKSLEMNPMDAATTMMGTGLPKNTMGAATMQHTAAQTLAGLMTLEAASGGLGDGKGIDNAWRGAEAYHFWLLAHRQLYAGNVDLAMRTALQLREYEDILDPQEIYSFLGLASFYNKFFGQCSKAFIKFESLPGNPDGKRLVCVASGKIIRDSGYMRCKTCKHPMVVAEVRSRTACPLCHATLPPPAVAPDVARQGAPPKSSPSRGGPGGGGAPYGAAPPPPADYYTGGGGGGGMNYNTDFGDYDM